MSRTAFKDLPDCSKEARKRSLAKYAKTKKGFLCRLYKNMRHRIEGKPHKKAHLYYGLQLMPRIDFYYWALNNKEFNELFDLWILSGYNRKLTPSIDRINTSKGYITDNIRWLIHSENSRLGAISRWGR